MSKVHADIYSASRNWKGAARNHRSSYRWLLIAVGVVARTLVLGCIATLTSAWIGAAFLPVSAAGRMTKDVGWILPAPSTWSETAAVRHSWTASGVQEHRLLGSLRVANCAPGGCPVARSVVVAGWPIPSLAALVEQKGGQSNWTMSGFELPSWFCSPFVADTSIGRRLPIAPLWPQFAANVAIWGAALWFAQLVLGLWRRRRCRQRRSAGRCSVCGYELRGRMAICPECGTSG